MSTTPAGDRRSARPGEEAVPGVSKRGGIWRIGSLPAARALLRDRHRTTQAGFTAEYIPAAHLSHRPILIADGPQHDQQRKEVARFFAPAVLRARYCEQIIASAERRLDEAAGPRGFLLDELALHFTVEVTADIVGLSHDRPRDTPATRERRVRSMARRLVAVFDQPPFDLSRKDLGRTGTQWAQAARRALVPIGGFFALDVWPALRQRRRSPGDDVISHLVRENWSTANILIEALTYGTAGMVTTREFIAMAAWHLLTTPDLAARYRAAPEDERLAILAEIIRLEPVVGHLYRRVQEQMVLTDGDTEHVLEAGDLVDVQVRDTNTDARHITCPLHLTPDRELPSGVRPPVLAFGEGAHRCPGEPLALLEADILLTRLLARDPQLVHAPHMTWDDLISGYELRDMRIVLGR